MRIKHHTDKGTGITKIYAEMELANSRKLEVKISDDSIFIDGKGYSPEQAYLIIRMLQTALSITGDPGAIK